MDTGIEDTIHDTGLRLAARVGAAPFVAAFIYIHTYNNYITMQIID